MLHFVPSAGFLNLSTASSALELAGLFHPAATSRVIFRSRASLPPQPPFLIGRSFPPCRCCIAALTHGPTFAGSPISPRATPLDFEASICARPRSSGPVIHLAQSRSPLRIPRSSRCSLSRRRLSLSRSPSAHHVPRSVFVNMSVFRLPRSDSTARHRFSKLVRTSRGVGPRAVPRRFDHLAKTEVGVATHFSLPHLSVPHRGCGVFEQNKVARGVAASCIFRCGALDAAISFTPLVHPCGCSGTRTISFHLAMFRDRSTVHDHLAVLMSALVCLIHPRGCLQHTRHATVHHP
jgi:hypothetical protein